MVSKSKEKLNKKSTKDKRMIDLDNEITLNIRTLPMQEELPRRKNTKQKKKSSVKTNKQVKSSNRNKTTKKIAVKEERTNKNQSRTNAKLTNTKPTNTKLAKKNTRLKSKIIFRLIKWTSISLILIAGGIYFLLSSTFNIKNIETIGNNKITKEELISLSGIQLEENTFKVQIPEAQQRIKQNAYVESVIIKRELPNTIKIQIQERTPTYLLEFANAYVYINNQGYFLEISQTKLDLPIIIGYSTKEEELHVGNRLCLEDLQKLDKVLQIMRAAQSNEIDKLVTKINIQDKQNYILELQEEKKTVHIGDTSNLTTKMVFIKKILEENKNIEGEILVNTDLSVGAVFRQKV